MLTGHCKETTNPTTSVKHLVLRAAAATLPEVTEAELSVPGGTMENETGLPMTTL